jgi:hypothetical protein
VNTLDFWLTKPSFDMNCIYSYNQVIIFKLNFCVNIYIYIYIYLLFFRNEQTPGKNKDAPNFFYSTSISNIVSSNIGNCYEH